MPRQGRSQTESGNEVDEERSRRISSVCLFQIGGTDLSTALRSAQDDKTLKKRLLQRPLLVVRAAKPQEAVGDVKLSSNLDRRIRSFDTGYSILMGEAYNPGDWHLFRSSP